MNAKEQTFNSLALQIFQYQYQNNALYKDYCNLLHKTPDSVGHITEIPFLPISFFKSHQVLTDNKNSIEKVFESSGTTGSINSKHFISDLHLYNESLLNGFRQFYGNPNEYVILALLPSYLERGNASLVYMAERLMFWSGALENGFYLNEFEKLYTTIQNLLKAGKKTILIGVTFALLDFAESFPGYFNDLIVMETGGMKGRRKEMTRTEVHHVLCGQWNIPSIHSEYGMTELLSQGYSKGEGLYFPANTLKVLIRDINDPLEVNCNGTGAVNIIDLANVNSCTFIATEDLGIVHKNGSFEILGRMDFSALRGCSLLTV